MCDTFDDILAWGEATDSYHLMKNRENRIELTTIILVLKIPSISPGLVWVNIDGGQNRLIRIRRKRRKNKTFFLYILEIFRFLVNNSHPLRKPSSKYGCILIIF